MTRVKYYSTALYEERFKFVAEQFTLQELIRITAKLVRNKYITKAHRNRVLRAVRHIEQKVA